MLQRWHSWHHLKRPSIVGYSSNLDNCLKIIPINTICPCSFSLWIIYRLTHSASELSGFTCTSSITMNEKFQYRMRPPSAVLKNFEFIVSERVQVNPDNSRAMSALTFLLFKLNTLEAKIVKLWVSQSRGVMIVVYRIYTTAITPRYWRQGGWSVITQSLVVQINQSENRNSYSVWKLNNKCFYVTAKLIIIKM